jgi:MFS family permease
MQEPAKKANIRTRYFKLRLERNSLIVLSLFIIIYLSWLLAFPLFGPINATYFNGFKALGIEKGKWILLFLASTILSNLASGFLVDKTRRRIAFILISTIIAAALTFSFVWISYDAVFLLSILLGLAAGLSPVAWGAYFADHTLPEDRGRIMGISIGLAIPIAQIFLLTELSKIGVTTNLELLIAGIWLLLTFLALGFKPKENTDAITSAKARRGPPPKQIALYAIPMFLFFVVAGILQSIVFPTIQNLIGNDLFYLIWAIPFIVGAIFAGIQLDLRGRKFPTIIGLAITGVSLAVLGILGLSFGYICVVPLAVGYSFVIIASFVIWADLAPAKSRGMFYGVGLALMATAQMIGLILTGTSFGMATTSQINAYMLFSSVALFLCIPPLLLAEEALPKELIEKRQLLDYLDGVKGKFAKKKET